MKKSLLLVFFICISLSTYGQERLLKVSSRDSINGEPKISAWFGANMKMNGYYNIKGGLQAYDTFNLDKIDVYGTDDRQNLGVDLYQTQIRFDASYIHPLIGKIRAHTSWDFWGGNGQMRLRKAYVMTDHWQLGQDWENFGDQNIWPNVLDFDGPPSGIWARVPFLKYFNSFDKENTWRYEIALQAPMVNYESYPNVTPGVKQTYQNTPDAVLAGSKWGDWGHVRLSTVFRTINLLEDDNETKAFGYGASLSAMFGSFGKSNFQFQYALGQGISAYIVSFGGSGYDGYPTQNGFNTTPSNGGWVAYEYYLTPKVHFNAVLGFTQFSMTDIVDFEVEIGGTPVTIQNGSNFLFHNYYLLNVLWDPYPNFSVGVELDFGTKTVKDSGTYDDGNGPVDFSRDKSRDASRISFGFLYNF